MEQRTVILSVRVSTDDVKRLDEFSRTTFRTRSDVVRLALAQLEAQGLDVALRRPPEAATAHVSG